MDMPTPGSKVAQEQGCLCPIMDNNYGAGTGRGGFWVDECCPLHAGAAKAKAERDEINRAFKDAGVLL